MPAEDRDRLFEQAMAGELRRGAANPPSACLDAETLAAYHERLLSAEELAASKQHVVSCARCQEILAHLEVTQDVEQFVPQDQELVPAGAVASMVAFEEASPAPRTAPATAAAPRPLQMPKRPLSRWAVPAGAIAAVLLLWIGVRTWQSDRHAAFSAKQISDNRTSSNSEPQAQPAAPPAETLQAELEKKVQDAPQSRPANDQLGARATATVNAPAARSSQSSRGSVPQTRSLDDQLRSDSTPVAGGKIFSNQPSPDRVVAQPAQKEEALSADSQAQSQAYRELDAAKAKSAAPPPVASKKSNSAEPASAAPPPPAPAESHQVSAAAAELSTSAVPEKDAKQIANFSNAVLMRDEALKSAADPQGQTLWRFGASGLIFHSSDRGKSWQAQASGVPSQLLAGSAPSKNVCWLAGASGTLLRTTDGGNHWQRVNNPISGDIVGVTATDAGRASIWDAGRKSVYQTYDAGATWTLTQP